MPFHIDHAFAGPAWNLTGVEVGEPDHWLEHSDHMPVVIELERVGQSAMEGHQILPPLSPPGKLTAGVRRTPSVRIGEAATAT